MPLGAVRSVETDDSVDVLCACAACGTMWTARVCATGIGHVGTYFVGQERAKERATNSAHYDAIDVATRALQFVACEGCRKPIVGPRRHWLVKLLPGLAVIMVGCAAYPLLANYMEPNKEYPLWAGFVGGGALCAMVIAARIRDRNRALAAAGAIRWFRGEPPDKPYVGVACSTCKAKIDAPERGMRCAQCGSATHAGRCADDHALDAHTRDTQGIYRRPRRR